MSENNNPQGQGCGVLIAIALIVLVMPTAIAIADAIWNIAMTLLALAGVAAIIVAFYYGIKLAMGIEITFNKVPKRAHKILELEEKKIAELEVLPPHMHQPVIDDYERRELELYKPEQPDNFSEAIDKAKAVASVFKKGEKR